MKRLSSRYTKYAILAFVFLPIVGLVICFTPMLWDNEYVDRVETGNILIPIVTIASFFFLAGLFMLSIFNEVYYDK